MKPAIKVIGEKFCTGCYGCYSACPKQAIVMGLNDEGFLVPSINEDVCNGCGLCQDFCPVLNKQSKNVSSPDFFAVESTREDTKLQSSSGGVFSELAKTVFASGGVVFGAAFDRSFILRHVMARNERDLRGIRGSKYVQSHVGDAYKEAASVGFEGKPLLFCGSPGQIAALRLFLDKKGVFNENKQIYLVDFVCHGVPSELVFRSYLDSLVQRKNSELTGFGFRDKKISWNLFGVKASFKDGSEYFKVYRNDCFMVGYLKNIYLRPSCYSCPFAKLPRSGDLTIGDFWGVPKKLYSRSGVSVVAVNNTQGSSLFSEVVGVNKVPVSFDEATRHNLRFVGGPFERFEHRAEFFDLFRDEGYGAVERKYLKEPLTFGSSVGVFGKLKRIFKSG